MEVEVTKLKEELARSSQSTQIEKHVCRFSLFIAQKLHTNSSFKITPNKITLFSTSTQLLALLFLLQEQLLLFTILFSAGYILDCTDGVYARLYNMTTKFGAWLDHGTDWLVFILYWLILIHLFPDGMSIFYVSFWIFIFFLFAVHFLLYQKRNSSIHLKYIDTTTFQILLIANAWILHIYF